MRMHLSQELLVEILWKCVLLEMVICTLSAENYFSNKTKETCDTKVGNSECSVMFASSP